jgi:hypothetical protein
MGQGWGSGFFRPWSWRRGFCPAFSPTADEETAQLKEDASSLRDILSSIERRLGELEKERTKA